MTIEECVKRLFGKDKELEEGNEMEDKKTAVASPWITYARRVHKLFELDPEVKVSYDNEGPELKLYVESQEKAEALEEVMPNEVEFGNVTMAVTVVPANIAEESPYKKLLKAFKGNPIVSYTESLNGYGQEFNYIVFQPEVVQYYNDNMGDIHGVESTLYQDIAKEVFAEKAAGVFFCTDIEDETFLGRPLGEWP